MWNQEDLLKKKKKMGDSGGFFKIYESIISVQSLSCVQVFVFPWTIAQHAFLSITKS